MYIFPITMFYTYNVYCLDSSIRNHINMMLPLKHQTLTTFFFYFMIMVFVRTMIFSMCRIAFKFKEPFLFTKKIWA